MSPSVDVFIGGAITAAIALIGVVAERRWAHKLRKSEKLEEQSAIAFSAQVKIASAHGWLRSTYSAINECFSDAGVGTMSDLDPGVKVKPLVGNPPPAIDFTAEELALLLGTGDQGLTENLLAFQWTLGTIGELVAAFNRSRIEYSRFVADSASSGEFFDGANATIEMPTSTRHALDARIAELNTLVGELTTSLPESLQTSKLMMKRVESALRSVDGLQIRHVELE